jgi:putative acetyltransferase
MLNLKIREEGEGDAKFIREVHRIAFGRSAEAELVDCLRGDGYARVSLVAEADERVIGHVMLSDLPIATSSGAAVECFSLAPMAVLPEYQEQGVGRTLVNAALEASRALGCRVVVVLGHRTYYLRFGFSACTAQQIEASYGGEDFMALELVPGALAEGGGRVTYPPPFALV